MSMQYKLYLLSAILLLLSYPLSASAQTANKPPTEADYYKLLRFQPPADVVLEAGAIEMMPDGKVAVATRRGEIWLVDQAFTDNPARDARWTRFAHGLHEVLGLACKDGWLYATQRGELSRLKDADGDPAGSPATSIHAQTEEMTMSTTTSPEITTEVLHVPGATLSYDVRRNDTSTKPPVMLIGNPMAAAGFVTLAGHLADRTVVTYDPRGCERSEVAAFGD